MTRRQTSLTSEEFRSALLAVESWAGVRLREADVDRLVALQHEARYARQLAHARQLSARLQAVTAGDWSRVDGPTLAVLVTAHAALLEGLARFLPQRCASIPEPTRRSLFTGCCVLAAEDARRAASAALRALTVTLVLGPRAVAEVATRLERHVGTQAGVWLLETDAASPERPEAETPSERDAARRARTDAFAALRRVARAYARREGRAWASAAPDDELSEALVMAVLELSAGRGPAFAAALALDGALDVAHVRAVDRLSRGRQREARRRRTIAFQFEFETLKRDDDAETAAARVESHERDTAVREQRRLALGHVGGDRRRRAALAALEQGHTQQEAARRAGVTARTVRTYISELRAAAPPVVQELPPDTSGRSSRRSGVRRPRAD